MNASEAARAATDWRYEPQRDGTYLRHRPWCPWIRTDAPLAAVPAVAKGRREPDVWTCGACLKGDTP